MSRNLDVYLHGVFTGRLIQGDRGALRFAYDEAYQRTARAPALSVSMPVRTKPYDDHITRAFFSGILPEDLVRHRLARYLGVSEKNPFALLEAIGGECAGALALYPEGESPSPPTLDDIEVLDDQKLKEILELLKRRPLLAGTAGIRLSLAGAQDKIAVGVIENQITLMKGDTPTSHILKPLIADIHESVQNELFCLHLAKAMNIQVPQADIRWLGDTPYLLVERYDRIREKNGQTVRLHQEDFCQALGILPELKYEREGGPNISRSLGLLQRHSTRPAADRLAFLRLIIFNYLIGNADAHGKNYSLLYQEGHPCLAPAYDLLSTTVYPEFSSKMAMKIGGKYDPDMLFLRHWHRLVPETATARKALGKDLLNMATKIQEHAQQLVKTLAQVGIEASIFLDIQEIIEQRATRILGFFR